MQYQRSMIAIEFCGTFKTHDDLRQMFPSPDNFKYLSYSQPLSAFDSGELHQLTFASFF